MVNFIKLFNKRSIRKLLTYSTNSTFSSIMEKKAVGMGLNGILEVLENFAPKSLAESWDNTGLLVEPYSPSNITTILLTNDLTEDVALEAKNINAGMIISYHPLIFVPLRSVVQKSWKERVVSYLLENRIALYSPHTSWDCIQGGNCDWLASCFPVSKSQPIIPGNTPEIGAGRLIYLTNPLKVIEIVEKLKKFLGLNHLRLAIARGKSINHEIGTIAICVGAGTSVFKNVYADLYLTGEMLHHDILDATQKGITVIMTNHSDSERGFLNLFAPKLESMLNDKVEVLVSKKDHDPVITI